VRGGAPGTREGDLKSSGAQGGAQGGADGQAANSNGGKGKSIGGGGGGGGGPQTSGNDDDIVARRLRKAAEDETDPELKERLWKEYNDYKKSAH